MNASFSPQWTSQKILKFREGVEASLADKIPMAVGEKLIQVFIFLLFCGLLNSLTFAYPNFLYLFLGFGIVLMPFLFVFKNLSANHPRAYFAFWLICLAFLSWSEGGAATGWVYFLVIGCSYPILWFTFLWLKDSSPRKRTVVSILAVLGLSFIYYCLRLGWFELRYLMMFKPQRLILLILPPLLALRGESSAEIKARSFRQFFFPFNFVVAAPTTLEHWQNPESLWLSKIRGFFDILVGTLFYSLFQIFGHAQLSIFSENTFYRFFEFGLYSYLETYLLSCGLLSLLIGFGRLLGFDLYDPFELPLLASSPFERWKKWNIYYFNFYRWFVFFPLAKRLKSLFIPVMLTFVVTLLFHYKSRELVLPGYENGEALHNTTAFFMAHGLAVYLSLRWRWKIFEGSARAGWFGVLLTWLLMIAIHTLNRWS